MQRSTLGSGMPPHPLRIVRRRVAALAVAAWLVWPPTLLAGPWPQLLGPTRDGHAHQQRLAERWPDQGLTTVWSVPLGMGYAGPVVSDGRVVVFHRVDRQERLEAYDAGSGERLWRVAVPASYRGGVDPDLGPRCVPLIARHRVIAVGAAGDCLAVEWATGQKLWSRPLARQYNAPEGYFGIGSTPLVYEDRLLMNLGGDGAGIVALDLADGETLWAATDHQASYSSPVLTTYQGRPAVAFVTRQAFVLLDPRDGQVHLSYPFGRRGPTVNAATPLVIGDRFFLTASYGIGAVLLGAHDGQLQELWQSDDVLSSQYNTPVYHDGLLFGIHGREDGPPADLRCVDAASGRVLWNHAGLGVAHLIAADGKLLVLTATGQLRMVRATGEDYRQLAEAQVSSSTTRALPALAEGHLFFRDTAGAGGQLHCVKLPER